MGDTIGPPAPESATPGSDIAPPRARRHPIRWAVGTTGFVLVIVLGLVFGTQLGKDPTLIRSPLIGKPAPTFDLPVLDRGGTRIRSAELTGRLFVLNFWASWCVPCRQEAPDLEAFSQRWSPRGVIVIGVVYNDTEDNARAFRDEFHLSYPQVTDPGSKAALNFGVYGVPETYVVDERGIVMAKILARLGPRTLDDVIRKVSGGETITRQPGGIQAGP